MNGRALVHGKCSPAGLTNLIESRGANDKLSVEVRTLTTFGICLLS